MSECKEWRKIAIVRGHEGADIRFALCIWIAQCGFAAFALQHEH
jgi:hypothetical protein